MEDKKSKKKNFYDLCEIIEALRAPGGCPWDREQTHLSLKRYMIEEAYEAAETFESGDGAKMADELGDVLLQVVLHAQIGKENGEFTVDDITDAVSRKMITRHPHVFGDSEASKTDDVLNNWDEIKRRERGQEAVSEAMEGISKALPALTRGEKIYKKAIKAGMTELPDDSSPAAKIFSDMTVLVELGLDPEEELNKYLKKYINFFKKFEENT